MKVLFIGAFNAIIKVLRRSNRRYFVQIGVRKMPLERNAKDGNIKSKSGRWRDSRGNSICKAPLERRGPARKLKESPWNLTLVHLTLERWEKRLD